MTLTEQWKKGELEEGYYYVKSDWSDGVDIRYVHNGVDDWREITAPVPSYDRFCRLNHLENDFIKAHERINELKKENTQLHKFLEEFNALDVAKENKELKELLKEWREHLKDTKCDRCQNFIRRTDNAIGEK